MKIPMAMMLLITCNDGYQHCNLVKQGVKNYQTLTMCEKDLSKEVAHFSATGQQIFGKCVALQQEKQAKVEHSTPDKQKQPAKKIALHWNVTEKGDLYTKLLEQL